MPSYLSFLLLERGRQRSIRFKNRRFVRERTSTSGGRFPWREQMLRSGEWGSSARLGVGTSQCRGIGERGLSRGREAVVGFACWAPNQRAGRVASEAAALPQLCCLPGGAGAAVFPRRRDETRDQRSTTNPRAERVETRCSSPPGRGRSCVCRRQVRDLPPIVECTRHCSKNCCMRQFPTKC